MQSATSSERVTPPPPAIEIAGLTKVYGNVMAVDGLTMTVPQGSFFGFLGPNGAGKTTTIRMLTGLVTPAGGTIEVLGLPMPGQSLEIRRQIGVVPDDTLLFDYLTGAEYLQFVGRMYLLDRSVAKKRAGELMNLFELGNESRKLILDYSKGMRKRLAMAAALIHRPRLFLMDEPFEGVDAVGARLMKNILLEQVRRGATIFLTSHVLDVVERLCDRLAIINEGKILIQGTMEEVKGNAGVSDERDGATGAAHLEDVFVRLVGARQSGTETLDWL